MLMLVATTLTQGSRENDFDHCLDGELVYIQEPCGRDRRRDPDSCGFGRAFAGVASHSATTTAEVRSLDMTPALYEDAIRMSLVDGGWPEAWAGVIAYEMLLFASHWPEGAVLERDLDVVRQRVLVD